MCVIADVSVRRCLFLTTDDAQAGLEAVAAALEAELVVHLRIDVLQRREGGASRVTVVPSHQWEPSHEQVLTNLLQEKHGFILLSSRQPPVDYIFDICYDVLIWRDVRTHLFLHGRCSVSVSQSCPTWERSQNSQHCLHEDKKKRFFCTALIKPMRCEMQCDEWWRLTLCCSVPSTSQVAHHLTRSQVTVKVLRNRAGRNMMASESITLTRLRGSELM